MLHDRARQRYDRNELKNHAEEIVTSYLGPGHDQGGTRLVWTCPACRKEQKYSIRRRDQLAYCLNTGCELGPGTDVLTLIAHFEGLDVRNQFAEVLKRGYELLGIDPVSPHASRTPRPQPAAAARTKQKRTPEEHERWRALCHRIHERLMALCPLETRDRKYLRGRGLTYETIDAGRFGSISAERARYLKKTLLQEFGREDLLQAPGFFEDSSGRLGFTLTGDYLLIPYYDREGNIANVEGRTRGEIPKHMGKYVSLRRSGDHLYLFPPFAQEPEKIAAFTEGVFGAIVAAQNGLVVASIQGCNRYKTSFSDLSPDGGDDAPLPELRGVDFAGRAIPYIPDADDPPNPDVLDAAPKAAHYLVERVGGAAALCSLPKGMDLDEWLLSIPKGERRDKFVKLVSGATPLADADRWKQEQNNAPVSVADATAEPATRIPKPTGGTQPAVGEELPEDESEAKKTEPPPPDDKESADDTGAGAKGGKGVEASRPAKEKPREDRELTAAVYTRLLEKCPPAEDHKGALARRGVLERAVEVGRLASLDPGKAARVTAELKEEFGAEDLVRVPGFDRGQSGKISFGLPTNGEYILLPCFDSRGTLRGLEALEYDPEVGDLSDPEKTLQLDGAGAHLYVFAHHSPAEIEGFCEGPIGAILAAQQDAVLGAVGHFRRYSSRRPEPENAEADTILPELAGVDFEERNIIYVPRSVSAEAKDRAGEAGHALRYLIEKQNGQPNLIFPSDPLATSASTEPTSMAEWIVALPEAERQAKLKELFPESPRRASAAADDDVSQEKDDVPPADDNEAAARPLTLPSTPALALMGLVGLLATLVAYLLIARLQSFSEYVGVGFGGQPFIGGGTLGAMRRMAGSAPFETLYDHKLSLSLLTGLAALSAALYVWHARRRLVDLAGDLQLFATGPWSAHQFDGDQRREEQLLGGFISAEDLLWSVLGGVGSFVLIYLTFALVEKIQAASTAFGLASRSYASLFANSTTFALIGALAAGLYVLLNRTGKHRGRARIAQGRIRS